jgi:hypothetical protein
MCGGRAEAGMYGRGKVSWGRTGRGGMTVVRWHSGPVGIVPDSMQFMMNLGGRGSNQSHGDSDLHCTRSRATGSGVTLTACTFKYSCGH